MIKIRLKKNLIYLLAFYISWLIRSILTMITQKKYPSNITFIYLYLMIFAEIIGGLLMYLYQNYSSKRQKHNVYLSVNSLKRIDTITITESKKVKRLILIFFASFFDFYEVILSSYYGPKINLI